MQASDLTLPCLHLVQVVDGNRMVATNYNLAFKSDQERHTLCKRKLGGDDLQAFRKAISKDYYFQFVYDDLPIWGYVGKVETVRAGDKESKKLFLFIHFQFDVAYNGDRIIEINVSTDPTQVVDISEEAVGEGGEVTASFTYTVTWKPTSVTFERRMDKYRKYQFLKQHLEIHWFSIINSCVTVLLLTGFLATILMRVLKNDFVKYNVDDEDPEDQEESGWKFLHGDVFRFPPARSLFCAFVGTGLQLLTLSFCVFALALVGAFYPYNRGSMFTALIVLYALTAGISGHTSASYYRQMEGTKWVGNLMSTCIIFCGPLILIFCFNNSVAWAYRVGGAALCLCCWVLHCCALKLLLLGWVALLCLLCSKCTLQHKNPGFDGMRAGNPQSGAFPVHSETCSRSLSPCAAACVVALTFFIPTCTAVHRRPALWHDCHRDGSVGHGDRPPHCGGWRAGQEHARRLRRPLPH